MTLCREVPRWLAFSALDKLRQLPSVVGVRVSAVNRPGITLSPVPMVPSAVVAVVLVALTARGVTRATLTLAAGEA